MSNEIKIGLTVILAVLAGYIGFRFMSDMPMFRQAHEIVSTFNRVDGLASGNIVVIQGVKIGSVKSMEFTRDNRVRVIMTIEADVPIPEDSVARLVSSGILEGKSIEIRRGTSGDLVGHGGEIRGVYVESIMETFGEKGEVIGDDITESFTELNRFLIQLNNTLDEESRSSIGQAITNIETTTSALSRMLTARQQDIEEAVSSANRMMAQLDTMATDNRPRVDSLLVQLDGSVREFRRISEDLDQTVLQLNGILFKIEQGEGTLGKLVNDPSLYHNADSLSVELRNLIKGINENPGRYLRHMNLIDIF